MHTNPICHWSGATAPVGPLLDLDYRAPRASVYPQTSAEAVALGLPAPTAIYTMQELASPLIDTVGGVALTPGGTGIGALVGQRASGLYWNGSLTGASKKAIELVDPYDHFQAPDVNVFNVGLNSFAFYVEFRVKLVFSATGSPMLFTKQWTASPYAGYLVKVGTAGSVSLEIRDGIGSSFVTKSDARFVDGSWHRGLVVLNRTALTMQWFTDLGNSAVIAVTRGDLTSIDQAFRIFGGTNAGVRGQISQLLMWIGPSAESLGQAQFDILNVHGTDPNPVPLNVFTHTDRISDLCGYTAGFGVHLADWSTDKLPIGWNQRLNAGAGGLGLGVWRAASSLLAYSDDFSNAAWVKSGTCVVSIASAALNDSPRGMREAAKMTVAAGAGYVSAQTATAAETRYTFDVFIKRHSTAGGNVNGNIEMYNATGGVSVATQAFVATTEWQRIKLTAVTQAGQVATQWRINVTDANGILALNRATVVAGYMSTPIFRHTAAGGFALTDYRLTNTAPGMLPGKYQKGAQGEIDLNFAANDGSNGVQRNFLNELSFWIPSMANAHVVMVNNIDLHEEEVYNNAAGMDHVAFGTVINMAAEHNMRYRWNTAGLPSGNTSEIIEDGGAPIAGSVASWVAGDTVDYYFFGEDDTANRQIDGHIARMRFWAVPQP